MRMNYLSTVAIQRVYTYGSRLHGGDLVGSEYLASPQKAFLDRAGAGLLLPLAMPVIWAARLAVWADDGTPTEIGLPRVGQGGVVFYERKIRSMHTGSVATAPTFPKRPDDPRITQVGGMLRRTSVDELPQIMNVLAGEMSLVGPRPKTIEEFNACCEINEQFGSAYTACKPGITGLEQINGRGRTSPEERIQYAITYAETASFVLDLEILHQTIGAVAAQRGAF